MAVYTYIHQAPDFAVEEELNFGKFDATGLLSQLHADNELWRLHSFTLHIGAP